MNSKKILLFSLILALVTVFFTADATAEQKNEYIIGFRGRPDGPAVQQAGGEVIREFNLINAAVIRMSPQAVTALQQRADIRYIEPNHQVYILNQDIPWGIKRVFAKEDYPFFTWEITRGENVGVAVLDTGIDEDHEDLTPLAGGVNTIDDTHWGRDVKGHGTAVAGVIAALDNEWGVVGVSHGIDLYSVKVMDDKGSGNIDDLIAGIEWAVAEGIPVINMSLGAIEGSPPLKEAVDEAYDRGHLLIAAAGNDDEATDADENNNIRYPARYESVIAVAASNSSDDIADFSSTGEDIELIAPGEEIHTTTSDDNYAFYSGTSMAAPHVAGAAVLAWSAEPDLTNKELRKLLNETADDLGLNKEYQGSGLVRPDLLVAEFKRLDDTFELKINIKDLAGDDYLGQADIIIVFHDTTNSSSNFNEEQIEREIDFSDTRGIISWEVGTGSGNDIVLENLSPQDINEITIKINGAEETSVGYNRW